MTRQEYLKEVFGTSLWKNINPIFLKESKQVKTINEALNYANQLGCSFITIVLFILLKIVVKK